MRNQDHICTICYNYCDVILSPGDMASFQAASTTAGNLQIRSAEGYKREMMGFGIEVLKYPRTGKPGLRIMILSLEPLSLYYVGKSGKRKSIDLTRVTSMRRGNYNPAAPQSASFPSPVFNTTSDSILRASAQFSFELDDEGRDSLDLEITTLPYADYFEAVLGSLLPNLINRKVAVSGGK